LKEAIEYIERHPALPDETPADDEPTEAAPRAAAILPPPARPSEGLEPSPNIRLLAQPAVAGSGRPSQSPPAATPAQPTAAGKLESLTEQILVELRRRHEQQHMDFSMPKLLAGVVQVLAIGALVLAYLSHEPTRVELLLAAIALQILTATLLLMGRR
jgi:hypothetical protein